MHFTNQFFFLYWHATNEDTAYPLLPAVIVTSNDGSKMALRCICHGKASISNKTLTLVIIEN